MLENNLTDLDLSYLSSKKDKSQLEESRNKKLQQLKERFTEEIDINGLFQEITDGNIQSLSTALTLIESLKPTDKAKALKLIELAIPHSGNSFRIGISGTPGAGKSTFINKLGSELIDKGHRVAVLTIDPSSNASHGSILGDKTRMTDLSVNDKAYIRPSPTGKNLGGVALKTRESILLCEAAGFDIILVETVGVGQSEVQVQSMVDFYAILIIPGSGDELQGIKRGIIELADLIVVNKADGDNITAAEITKQNYSRALHLFPKKNNGWTPTVITTSATQDETLSPFIEQSDSFKNLVRSNGFFQKRRHAQQQVWYEDSLKNILDQLINERPEILQQIEKHKTKISQNQLSPPIAAQEILDLFKNV